VGQGDVVGQAQGRAQRRAQQHRRRRFVVGGLATVTVVAIAGMGALALGGDSEKEASKASVDSPTVPTTVAPATAPSTVPAPKESLIATTKGSTIEVYAEPGDGAPKTLLSPRTDYGVVRTLLVTKERPDGWLQVMLPMRPNGSTGWIRLADVTLSTTTYEIKVDLEARKLVLKKGDEVILEADAGIGTEATPTPKGEFYITDPVDLRKNPGSSYGVFALGISGYSEVHFEFAGGPGQLAVHGTNDPSGLGKRVSNGCIRVHNDVIMEIATTVPLGTPVRFV
jgi:lipoprotein-anchoring transpeptidase ErfK/SrfK